VAMMVLPEQIVKLLYQHGSKFTDSDVQLTAWALLFISTGMIGWIGRDLMTRVFYALEDTKTPVIVATFGFVAYALFAWIFIPMLDHAALAFSYALTSTLNMLVLAMLAAKKIQHLFNRAFFTSIIRGLIAATMMALVIYYLNANIILLTIVGAALYALCLIIMKEPVLLFILNKLRRRRA
jgi:putative peptidoglycan lipid II flippase